MKGISTGTYLLSKMNEKHFGGVTGYVFLPDYRSTIKIFLFDNKKEKYDDGAPFFQIDNAQVFNLDMEEAEALKRAVEFITNSLKVLTQLSKRGKLDETAIFDIT